MIEDQLQLFDDDLAQAGKAQDCWQALQQLTAAVAGFKLFTVMIVDMENELARRAFTSDPEAYPVSGTKPIHYDAWFDIVHRQQKSFVANTIADIAKVFPDHEKIWSLGCGSVLNLPVLVDGTLTATINMLHEEHYYSEAGVTRIEKHLSAPARRAYLAASAMQT